MLVVDHEAAWNQPIVLTEFGGIAYAGDGGNFWGYSKVTSSDELLDRYTSLLATVRNLPTLAGFCYTQFTDTYQEANGLLYEDRTPKAPLEKIALATAGPAAEQDLQIDTLWRDHLMRTVR